MVWIVIEQNRAADDDMPLRVSDVKSGMPIPAERVGNFRIGIADGHSRALVNEYPAVVVMGVQITVLLGGDIGNINQSSGLDKETGSFVVIKDRWNG
jgi:hypothetical protein